MKKLLSILPLLIAAFLPCSSPAKEGSSADAIKTSPHLQLDSLYVDLGLISADTVATGVMRFRNTGNEPLVITRIFSDCGCTTSKFSRSAVQPGESDSIVVRFNGKGRNPGNFQKALRIRSNADNSREVFFVKGKIKRIYRK